MLQLHPSTLNFEMRIYCYHQKTTQMDSTSPNQDSKLQALKAHLLPGIEQAQRGEFVRGFSIKQWIDGLDAR